jgi:hypothetical protein
LVCFTGLAKARDESVFVHLRGLRRLYRGADVNFEQGLFRRYSGVKLILRVCLQHIHVSSWIIASWLQ